MHADSCELWQEQSFRDGHDEWDGDLGCLVLVRSPWQNPEEWVWDGDEPVVRVATAAQREVEVEYIGDLEQEALDALTQGAETDEYEWIMLADGSYADFTTRTTYRRITDDTGAPAWQEEPWDDAETLADVEVVEEHLECICEVQKRFYCQVCGVQRKAETDGWSVWDRTSYTTAAVGAATAKQGDGWDSFTHKWCNHVFETFTFPGATTRNVKISGKRFHTPTTTPDYGLYAYNGWSPDCVATFIPWQDYGLPKGNYRPVAEAIQHAYRLALQGQTVEVGCMGGHGRTGTMLACMVILADPTMSADEACKWVRSHHCNEAIETNSQEWFVEWFRAWHLGCPCPPKPATYVSKHMAQWTGAQTAAVAVRDGVATLPLAPQTSSQPVSQDDGQSTDPAAILLSFDRAVMEAAIAGETANARRRNAKRANRRSARKAKQNAR
jgi:hypothetical protein